MSDVDVDIPATPEGQGLALSVCMACGRRAWPGQGSRRRMVCYGDTLVPLAQTRDFTRRDGTYTDRFDLLPLSCVWVEL